MKAVIKHLIQFVVLVGLMSDLLGIDASIEQQVAISFNLEPGSYYTVERSEDIEEWTTVLESVEAEENPLVINHLREEVVGYFYRARELSSQWVLVWSDEFEGGQLDRSKWANDVNANGGGNNELQYYTDEVQNTFVENGKLVLQALDSGYSGIEGIKSYSSGKVHSKFRGAWAYGRIEVRAKLPIGQGIWPAIWMLPMPNEYGGWASSGEIDIMELLGHEPSTVHGTIHYGNAWPNNTSNGGSYELSEGTFADAFHTFAIEWEFGEIRWYVDGELYRTSTNWFSVNGVFPAPFDKPFYIIMNVAVGGDWPGSPNATTPFPAKMEVDWVRVYQWQD